MGEGERREHTVSIWQDFTDGSTAGLHVPFEDQVFVYFGDFGGFLGPCRLSLGFLVVFLLFLRQSFRLWQSDSSCLPFPSDSPAVTLFSGALLEG